MKKLILKVSAIALCLSGLTNAIPVHSAYNSADEITFSLRAMEGGYIPETNLNKIYISPEDAKNGTTIHAGMYIEADYADLAYISAVLQSENENIIFQKETFQSPNSYAYAEAQDFILSDGTSFSTRFKPFCLGRINSMNRYEHGVYDFGGNIQETLLNATWLYDLKNKETWSADFFGSSSDELSFIDFDIQIAPETESGIYAINFVTKDEFISGATYLTSDDSIPDEEHEGKYISIYHNLVPTLKPLEIVISETNPVIQTEFTEANAMNCFRYAHDTTDFSVQDFATEINFYYGGDEFTKDVSDLLDTFTAGSPEIISIEEPVIYENNLTFAGLPVENSSGEQASLKYYIGQKGDVNLDGEVNAEDASVILTYSAEHGAGNVFFLADDTDNILENFAYFLGDIDGESQNAGQDGSKLDASDASLILQYSALKGAGHDMDWNALISE
ncbi:MAG: hypothetical protein K2J88_00835 [Oscillospiraceae bacterium]|nr:hypothetical protein [Oscillospiraceae bacterium]